jgi:soluble cytochrome b562
MSTAPVASQNVVQPAGTQFSTNNLANARYVTSSWNWLQTPTDNLGTAGNNTIHLSPCPLGIDTSNNANAQYAVYIAGTGTAEAAPVTGGNCTAGSGAGTITVTTAYSHTAGYTVGSATSGIQDARNTAKQDSELEATKARVQRLEQIAATNTEARIRSEVELGELRDGQNEIKALIQAHDSASRKMGARK